MGMKEAKGHEDDCTFAQLVNAGDKVEGRLTEKKPSEKYGMVFMLETAKGNMLVVGKTDLNSKMEEVPVGANVSIELKEIVVTANKNNMKIFKVLYDDGNIIEDLITGMNC